MHYCSDYLLKHFPPFFANHLICLSCPSSHAQLCECPPLPHPLVTIFQYGYPRNSPPPSLVTICLPYRLDYPTLVMYLTLTRVI